MRLLYLLPALLIFMTSSCKKEDRDIGPSKTENEADCGCNDQQAANYSADAENGDCCFYLEDSKPLFLKFTSTDCYGCGRVGHPLQENTAGLYHERITTLSAHIRYTDPYKTVMTKNWEDNFNLYATPSFYVNDSLIRVTTGDSSMYFYLRSVIDEYLEQPNEFKLGGIFKELDGTLEVHYGLKPDNLSTTGLSIGVYLVEDNIFHAQAGRSENLTHHNFILRKSLNGDFGRPLDDFTFNENGQAVHQLQTSIDDSWKSQDIYIVLIIWKKNTSGTYEAVTSVKLESAS